MFVSYVFPMVVGLADPEQQLAHFPDNRGWFDRLVDFGFGLLSQELAWIAVSVMAALVLTVLVVQFFKRFAPLMPTFFEGPNWVLKIQLLAAVIGFALASTIAYALIGSVDGGSPWPPSGRALGALVAGVFAAFGSPPFYDYTADRWPNFMLKIADKRRRPE